MAGMMAKFGIGQLDIEQRIALIEEIWESIDAERLNSLLPSRAQLEEFEARMHEERLDDDDDDFDFDDGEDLIETLKQH